MDEFITVVSVPCIRVLDVRKSAGKLPLFLKVHHFILYRKCIERKRGMELHILTNKCNFNFIW